MGEFILETNCMSETNYPSQTGNSSRYNVTIRNFNIPPGIFDRNLFPGARNWNEEEGEGGAFQQTAKF